ncbi:hypothetical protein [Luteibaculum oceani]|uniref:Uncharacterized protein n=1 Tax=Luteibaculum oceani TaxID=1294296 RepID=A0A5C6UYH3_9FLAO|nr:hypothetical protein [Luteibaculum oceani]TXC78533.1 hypothetical protein FRX97_07380 [Luteibaculum oceani]
MHTLEPFYRWRSFYVASEDVNSPFYQREYSEFEFTHAIYDHVIHPQWDEIGSPTLFMKLIYADYMDGYAVIELIGEWNDCIHNDIMILKRDIIDELMNAGLSKFILIGENVLNFHSSDDCYYEEWFEDVEDLGGWIALINFREHVIQEFSSANIDHYFVCGGKLDDLSWRTLSPEKFCSNIEKYVQKRLA